MKECYITFRSVTWAQRGEAVLKKRGIRSLLQRTPRHMEQQGCGYALRLPGTEAGRALEALKGEGILFRRVYRQTERGSWEEAGL